MDMLTEAFYIAIIIFVVVFVFREVIVPIFEAISNRTYRKDRRDVISFILDQIDNPDPVVLELLDNQQLEDIARRLVKVNTP